MIETMTPAVLAICQMLNAYQVPLSWETIDRVTFCGMADGALLKKVLREMASDGLLVRIYGCYELSDRGRAFIEQHS